MGLSQAQVSQLHALSVKVDKLFAEATVIVDRFAAASSNGQIPDERDVADGAFLCKKMYETMDYLRKSLENARRASCRWACEQWTMKELSGVVKLGTPIRGQLVTAKTAVKSVPRIPKKGTPDYEALCKDLGLSYEVYLSDTFHVHWPGIVELCSSRIARGEPLPKGIDPYLVTTDKELHFAEENDSDLSMRKAKD